MTLRWRLTFLYAASTAIVFLAALLVVDAASRLGLAAFADRELMKAVDQAVETIEARPARDPEGVMASLAAFSDEHDALFVTLFKEGRQILYQSDPELPAVEPQARGTRAESRILPRTVSLPKRGRIRLASVFLPGVSGGAWLQIGIPLPPSPLALLGWRAYAGSLFFAVLIAILGWTGWLIAGSALSPIERITEVARRVSRGALGERVPRHRAEDELGGLIDVLNAMLERIEDGAKKLSQFAANVSHQLKTPLTVMRGQIEVALRGGGAPAEMRSVLESNLAELEGLSQLVEDMLSYSRIESEGPGPLAPERLDLLVREVARQAEVLAGRKSQGVETDLRPVCALVNAVRLRQGLLNLVDNAVRCTQEGGRIVLRTGSEAGNAFVAVEDNGPGVAPEEIPRLFERGRSRSGTGIGLGLARALVESLSGRLEVSSAQGRGLTVRIVLPLAEASGAEQACRRRQ